MISNVYTICSENLVVIKHTVSSQDSIKVCKRNSEIGKVVRGFPTMVHAVLICGLMVAFWAKC